jgi:hypothetical protein
MKGALLHLRINSASCSLSLQEGFANQHLTLVGYQCTFPADAVHDSPEVSVNVPWLEGSHFSAGTLNANLTLPIDRGAITTERHGLNWVLFADRIPNSFTVKVYDSAGAAAAFGGANGIAHVDLWFNMSNTY